ncbi:hypothetical protein Q5P01_023473 [Channa striata]|uniref:Ig-like domain-containing protein n=1 Tax=Channa striata TaxID=64152 RepID=A0AA88ITK8_CHASR|nr:hypothetical protein Q5P01_023473 [Channa striata]
MDAFHVALRMVLVFCLITPGSSTCLIGCSCADENSGRSLLCMESSMAKIPNDLPQDLTKIRIENGHLAELLPGSFSRAGALEFLWLNFNELTVMSVKSLEGLANLTELRLQGNKLTSVPWAAFQDTPKLKILDLKNNYLDVVPEHALRHLPALTYLDLSFNQLSIISKDVFINWPLYQSAEKTWRKEGLISNVVLALHNNPWLCDCRLKGFVEFIRMVSPPIILMNSYLTCSGPASKAGRFFHETRLKTCMKPQASALETNITLPLGEKATLECLVTARPGATIQWMYSLKTVRGFAVTETRIDEDTVTSQLAIASLHFADQGLYTCVAKNFVGNTSVSVTVNTASSNYSARPLPPPVPKLSSNENASIDIRISQQTVYGVTLEWYTATDHQAESWFTIHFGKHDSPKKEMIYISPGISSYTLSHLLPVTKYEVCLTLKNHPPREGQCIAFMTGSNISELEQRERLIHVVVIVCAMVLAIPAGMFACTTEARFSGMKCCLDLWKEKKLLGEGTERQETFDSLRAAGDEEDEPQKRETCEERCTGGSAAHVY